MQSVAERLLSVSRTIRIAAPAAQVLAAWSGPLAIARWYVERRCGDALLDRPFAWYEPQPASRAGADVQAAERPSHVRSLSFLNDGHVAGDATELRVTIDSAATGTLLRVDQVGFDAERQAQLPRIASAWAAALVLLKTYVEAGLPRRRQTTEHALEAPRRSGDFAHAVASPQAVDAWSGDRCTSLCVNTAHDAVIAFDGLPGLVSLHLGRRLVISHTCWRDAPLAGAAAWVSRLAERLGAFVAVH